jgi:hypothetical protein
MLGESFGHLLPAWLSMGLAGVLGNTQVRDAEILVGGEEERRDAQQLMDMVTRAGGASR